MFSNPSLITRIAIGKGVGFLFGLLGLFFLPYFFGETDLMIRWGFVFWYTTVGAFIGVFGVFTWHPILKLPMPWWFRSVWIGAWMNFVLTLFIYDRLQGYMTAYFGENGFISSPFWFVLEGALVGLLIGFLATRFGGEGKETVGK
ncbi:MAG: hypothetical protein ACI9H8_000710 [Lysobacterales bacterium]|jgi:hypothetical protein